MKFFLFMEKTLKQNERRKNRGKLQQTLGKPNGAKTPPVHVREKHDLTSKDFYSGFMFVV